MKRLFIILIAALAACFPTGAQQSDDSLEKYRRSSICSMLISHPDYPYSAEIDSAFLAMPLPDKYNNHNLDLFGYNSEAADIKQKGAAKDRFNKNEIGNFFAEENVARELVAKWFNRDSITGGFDMNLIQERGFYDASALDISTAMESQRGLSTLGDAGEELIANTFVVMNDITFVDKGETSSQVASGIAILGGIAGLITTIAGNGDGTGQGIAAASMLAAAAVNEIDGFTVNITSYLYRLVWDEETAGTFYKEYWYPAGTEDSLKRAAFDASDIFKLNYVGATTVQASNTSSKNFSKITKSEQMLQVCARAVDNAVAELQKSYPVFRVKVPLYSVSDDMRTADVKIGLKEGVSEKYKYEVLMPTEKEDGSITYQRVGMLKPIKSCIWDNRFGALEDAQAAVDSGMQLESADQQQVTSALLKASTFKVVSGMGNIQPGYMVRETR